MPSFVLSPRSGLEHLLTRETYGAPENASGTTVALRGELALASVMVRKGKCEELAKTVQRSFNVAPPMRPRRTGTDALSFIWAGPGRWLAASSTLTASSLETILRDRLAGLASVVSQSHGRCVIRVSGPQTRDVLSRGVPIDLDAAAFAPGDTALTLAGHVHVHLWQIDLAPTYEFAIPRSFAASFCEWLFEASRG